MLQFHFGTNPLNKTLLSGDGATYERRSRQFHGVNVIVPGSENLIVSISIGQDLLKSGKTGALLTESIIKTLVDNLIKSDQLSSLVWDGAYFSVHVDDLLRVYLGRSQESLPAHWDWMHKCGLVDSHLTGEKAKLKEFDWVFKLCKLALRLIRNFQWGKEYEKFRSMAEELNVALYNLQFFAETRFANSKRLVFRNLYMMVGPCVGVLEQEIMEAVDNVRQLEAANNDVRKRGQTARELKGSFLNQQNLLLLAGLTDIYKTFGDLVNISQAYRYLPHQRLSEFDRVLTEMKSLGDHLISDCCENVTNVNSSAPCLTPHYHKALQSLKKDGTIQNVTVLDKWPTKGAGLNISTRSQRLQAKQSKYFSQPQRPEADGDSDEDIIVAESEDTDEFHNQIGGKLAAFADKLSSDLSEQVVNEKERELIGQTKVILDVKELMINLRSSGLSPEVFASISFPKFAAAADAMHAHGMHAVSSDILERQYRKFVSKLADLSPDDLSDIDSREVLKDLFNVEKKLFEDFQVILHIASTAATKSSCEAIIESYVSQYEYTANSRKNFSEEGINETFNIVKNGPPINKCDKVVNIAMKDYFKDKQPHMTTKNLFKKSKTILKVSNEKSNLPFMD